MKIISIEVAEKIARERLDRRYKYATLDDGLPDPDTGATLFNLCGFTTTAPGVQRPLMAIIAMVTPLIKNGVV